MYHVFSLK